MAKTYPEPNHIRLRKEVREDVAKYARIHKQVFDDGGYRDFTQSFHERMSELWAKEKENEEFKRQGFALPVTSQGPGNDYVPSWSVRCLAFEKEVVIVTRDKCHECAEKKEYLNMGKGFCPNAKR